MSEETIEVLLEEGNVFPPPEDFKKQAWVKDDTIYEKAEKDFEGFWAAFAEELHWFKKWDRVLDWDPPWAKWFINGKINVSYNCLDRHIQTFRKNKAALIWEGEPGDSRIYTYWDLYREVCKFANVLKGLGVKKGDRVAIYMPMVPELPIAMLACTRIGAPHSIVFGGFSPTSLKDRINDAEAKILITTDGGWRRGKVVSLKENADEALQETPSIEHVIVVKRTENNIPFTEGRDLWWHELMKDASPECEAEPMDAEDILYILYTSGTTAKPKGVVHTTGGYLTGVYATTKWVFDLKEEDTFWCTADIGWVTGHSYIVYGPLALGTTSVMFEGAPDYPDKDRFWDLVEKYGVTVFYTAPTAIRAFMQWGKQYPEMHNLSTLRLLGSVGEPINPAAWMWYYETIGKSNCPIVDTWWQTETGMILITPLPGVTTLKPGSATRPFPSLKADVLDDKGNSVPPGGGGYLVMKTPWPAMLRTLYKDPDRYVKTYWDRYGKEIYFPGDGAKKDMDEYIWILGRVDDVMNVSGHRISTMEVESALVDHPAVAEAAVVARPHEVKGQGIMAFVILKGEHSHSDQLEADLKKHVGTVIGPIARPDWIVFTEDLPKTRSGKIMRRLLKDIAEGKELGDTTTLRDSSIVEKIKDSVK
ncbi:MAG: acetate--CoA ligase [Theionarchaea archaeon]|nr:acetate--CoA ligase [Theionarchaea archaeon]MBU7037587.1 acetate--CoA ligase [Theionarchaea archaeon]